MVSLYFLPNICVPVIAGMLAHHHGAPITYARFWACMAVGNLLVFLSTTASADSAFGFLICGRGLMGVAYEAVDVLAIGMVAPFFEESFSTVVGITNGINRLGSVLNFVLEPVFYRAGQRGATCRACWAL